MTTKRGLAQLRAQRSQYRHDIYYAGSTLGQASSRARPSTVTRLIGYAILYCATHRPATAAVRARAPIDRFGL